MLRFTKEEAEVQKQALSFVPARYIRTSEASSEHVRLPLSETFCELFIKERHEHNMKTLRFLSLSYSADFGRSRLVKVNIHDCASEFMKS